MLSKTKATLPGRLCQYKNPKPRNNTQINAGGQNPFTIDIEEILSADKLWRYQPLKSYSSIFFQLMFNEFKMFFQPAFLFESFSTDSEIEWVMRFRESDNNFIIVIIFFNGTIIPRKVMHYLINGFLNFLVFRYEFVINHSHHFASFGEFLVCLRWRRLISFSKAVTTNWPVLSPVAFSDSTSSAIWCGTRTSNLFDFALIDLVAIAVILNFWCPTIVHKKNMNAMLDVSDTLALMCVRHLKVILVCKEAKPGSARTLTGPLTKQLFEVTVMAEQQHTQTRPKFTWLFLDTPHHTPEYSPIVLRCEADTEEAARFAFPCWDLVFAAKIRAEVPCRVAFFDYNSRRGWEFDSAAIQDVIHVDINTVARDCDIATPSRDIHMNTAQEVRHV